MKPINLPNTRIRIEAEKVLIAPTGRPEDWREVEIHLLDNWAKKQWQLLALQPVKTKEQS